jgi:hypothetical protein
MKTAFLCNKKLRDRAMEEIIQGGTSHILLIGKAVPLHAMGTLGVRGGIAPTQS